MAHPAPTDPAAPARWTVEQYLRLVDEGVLGSDDKVELLEGVIVTMAPANLPHDAGVVRVTHALIRAVGDRAVVRVQLSLRTGAYSLPEPDAAVVSGRIEDYDHERPRAIYAAGGIPEYWIVNLRDDCVEVRRDPEPAARRYTSIAIARRGERIELVGLPGVSVAVDDLLPSPPR